MLSPRWRAVVTVVLAVLFLGSGALVAFSVHRMQQLPSESRREIMVFESHVFRGERLVDLEKQFGKTIPKPDSYPTSNATDVSISDGKTYMYASGGVLCSETYDGIAVHVDSRGIVKSWSRVSGFQSC
jgi:hypothetical protein